MLLTIKWNLSVVLLSMYSRRQMCSANAGWKNNFHEMIAIEYYAIENQTRNLAENPTKKTTATEFVSYDALTVARNEHSAIKVYYQLPRY